MDNTDYNTIMEFIEQNLLGQHMEVKVIGDGIDELIYRGKLEDAEYKTKSEPFARRVPADFEGKIRLKFENMETTLSGYQLHLRQIKDYCLPNPSDSKEFLLGNGLDRYILFELKKSK